MVKNLALLWSREVEKKGEGACEEYRIPGIIATPNGTLVMCYEGRMATRDDWAPIQLVLCRSADDGATWHKQIVTLAEDMGGAPGDTLNNPTLIEDKGRLHLIFHWHYERAFHCVSEDDGLTWSRPEEMTAAYREAAYDWNVCATGPGHGVRMACGRLVAPIWLARGKQIDGRRREHHPSVAGAVYSDDGGATWHIGGLMSDAEDANETAVAELSDGRLLFNVRSREKDHFRRLAWSDDGGRSMTALAGANDLPDPWCFGSMATMNDGTVLFANCAAGGSEGGSPRIDQSIKQSCDGGLSWRLLEHVDDIGGYADIALHGQFLYILYERTVNGEIADLVLKKYRVNRAD